MASFNNEERDAAFDKVYEKQEALQELLDTGGEKDEDAIVSLEAIKNAGLELWEAIKVLSLTDFEEEFSDEPDEVADGSEDDTLDRIFS